MKEIEKLLQELTIEEKAALLEGYQSWMTNAVPRLGIPAIHLTDGPVGVRKKTDDVGDGVMGLGQSFPSTAFPTSVTIANGWNQENAEKMGRAIGEECVGYNVQVLLGPALNLKRDPRCGRNFEYYSEDPLLSGKMAAGMVKGIQSTGTAACPKHFALNNCENHRYMSDSVIDERAARELYLKSFEICVKEGNPWSMMCAYNKINGTHCSENKWLLTDVLREQWNFDGLVMTDWGATHERLAGVMAGLDLDMPGGIWENRKAIIDAAKSGTLSMEILNRAVGNVLQLIERCKPRVQKPDSIKNLLEQHNTLATDIATDCSVLLKNDGVLPLQVGEKVLVVGDLFEKMRYQGAGSSGLTPAYLTTPKDAFDEAKVIYTFAQGYQEMAYAPDGALEEEAIKAASDVDTVLFFGGLTESFESEGFDRENLSIPQNQLSLIRKLCDAGKRVIVVLFGGSVMELPFAEKVSAILYMALPGQGGGEACRRLLYGEANPGGRLSETWMKNCSDIPYGKRFSKGKIEQYRENIFVGYRFFDMTPKKIRYPFGYGLSYTTFHYENLELEHNGETIIAKVTVENTGTMAGAEVVQLYVGRNSETNIFKAQKELKSFQKVYLLPNEKKNVVLTFSEHDLAYFDTKVHRWVVENGKYPIYIGASSQNICLESNILVDGYDIVPTPYSAKAVASYNQIAKCAIPDSVFEETIGYPIPDEPPVRPYTVESPINDYQASFMGRLLYNGFMKGVGGNQKKLDAMPDGPKKDEMVKNQQFVMNLIPRNSTRALIQSGGGRMQMNIARAIVEFSNGHLIRGILEFAKKEHPIPLPCEENRQTNKPTFSA